MWLPEAIRLKTVDIYLPESSEPYMRRRHEPSGPIKYMTKKTCLQPNYRKYRSLRTLQGLDYVYCLRGLSRITFFDHSKWFATRTVCEVRDKSFLNDVRSAVYKRGDEHMQQVRRLRNLAPLLVGYNPGQDLWDIMASGLSQLQNELDDSYDDDIEEVDDESVGGSDTDDGGDSDGGSSSDSDSSSDSGADDDDGAGAYSVVVNHNQITSTPGSPNPSHNFPLIPAVQTNTLGFGNIAHNHASTDASHNSDIISQDMPDLVDLTLEDDDDDFEEYFESHGGDIQAEALTPASSQTIEGNNSPKSEPFASDDDVKPPPSSPNSPTDLNINADTVIGEGSLFVSNNSDVIDLTDENPHTDRDTLSPEDAAVRAINAHLGEPMLRDSPEGSRISSESNLFCSPTLYENIVPRSTVSGARTAISSGMSLLGSPVGSPDRPESGLFCSSATDSENNSTPQGNTTEEEIRRSPPVYGHPVDLTSDAGSLKSDSSVTGLGKRSHDEAEEESVRDAGSRKRARSERSPIGGSSHDPIEL